MPQELLSEEIIRFERDYDELSERILDSAFKIFSRVSIKLASMESIAKAANVGRTTIYRKFPDKRTLVEAVVIRECHIYTKRIAEAIKDLDDPAKILHEGLINFVILAAHHPLVLSLKEQEPDTLLPYILFNNKNVFNTSKNTLLKMVIHLQSKGYLTHHDSEILAEILFRFAHSLMIMPAGHYSENESKSLNSFIDYFIRSLEKN